MTPLHPSWKNKSKIVIGMLHLPALAGAPLATLSLNKIRDAVLRDADAVSLQYFAFSAPVATSIRSNFPGVTPGKIDRNEA